MASACAAYPGAYILMEVQEQKYRTERDTFGELQVPADRYWGAQTQRSA